MEPTALRVPPNFLPELKEKILESVSDEYADNPALQWTYCRHLSAHQKRRLERHFREYWLPKLVITVYGGAHYQADYHFLSVESNERNESRAHYRIVRPTGIHVYKADGSGREEDLLELIAPQESWQQYSFTNRTAHVRLGENCLNDGFLGGYIVNDTGLPGISTSDSGYEIWFDWVGAFDELLREEAMKKRVWKRMFELEIERWKQQNQSMEIDTVPVIDMVRIMQHKVQLEARIEVYKHRYRRHDPSGNIQPQFHPYSKEFHKQTPTIEFPDHARGGCFCCSRREQPDIWEVAQHEESVVPSLPDWRNMSDEALLDAYAEEFSWRCFGAKDDEKWRLQRKQDWKHGLGPIVDRCKGVNRWDILG